MSIPEMINCPPEMSNAPAMLNPYGIYNELVSQQVLQIEQKLNSDLQSFSCSVPGISFTNPLQDASIWEIHQNFITTFCGPVSVLYVGMNPGPNGMAINGVPFGNPYHVQNWMGIPYIEAGDTEDSGARLWGYMQDVCGTPMQFFQNCFVHNYCPLFFTSANGNNYAPNHFKAEIQERFRHSCDQALLQIIRVLGPKIVVGIGGYAYIQARRVLREAGLLQSIDVVKATHPSPCTRLSESLWRLRFTNQMDAAGVTPYLEPGLPMAEMNHLSLHEQ